MTRVQTDINYIEAANWIYIKDIIDQAVNFILVLQL